MSVLISKLIHVICDHTSNEGDVLDYPYYFSFECENYKQECVSNINKYLHIDIPNFELGNINDSDDLVNTALKYNKDI